MVKLEQQVTSSQWLVEGFLRIGEHAASAAYSVLLLERLNTEDWDQVAKDAALELHDLEVLAVTSESAKGAARRAVTFTEGLLTAEAVAA